MGKLSDKLRAATDNRIMFWCPGCDCPHGVWVGEGSPPRWSWNGDVDAPTFSPSIKVQYDRWVPPADTLEMAERIKRGEVKQTKQTEICHSFVRQGRIEYLSDCTQELAGKTIDLPNWTEEE